MEQNIYDNAHFFKEYQAMRKGTLSANDLIEIPEIRLMMPDLSGKRVLELGCGAGGNAPFFIEKGASFYLGTDISVNMINEAKNTFENEKVSFQVLKMEDLSTLQEQFDVIISSLAIHYVADFDKLCKDVYRLLPKEGYFIFSQEHPIGTGTILNEECQKEDKTKIGDKEYYLVSNYNENGKRIVDWNDCKVVKYHRNFSYLINTILLNQFKIVEFREPTPSEELLKIKPKLKNQFDKPYFLFVSLKKE